MTNTSSSHAEMNPVDDKDQKPKQAKPLPASLLPYYWDECKFAVVPYHMDNKMRVGNKGGSVAPQPREDVERMFAQQPNLNIAMVPGVNGVCVIDFDVARKKADGERDIVQEPGFLHLPETPSVTTPSGGRHYYFKIPYGLRLKTHLNLYKQHPVHGQKGTGALRKVDFLSEKHAGVVLPPSDFGHGEYQWEVPIGSVEMAELPLRVLLAEKISSGTIEKGFEWLRIVEQVNLADGDYRNGAMISFATSLYATLLEHGNTVAVAREAVVKELSRQNQEFSQPLDRHVLSGITNRFLKYSHDTKKKDAQLFSAENATKLQQSVTESDAAGGDINWAEALQGGFTDGKNYELDLFIKGKLIHLDEINDKNIEKPQYIARRCRHVSKDTSISSPYYENAAGLEAWLKDVLAVWLPKIKGDTASDSLNLGKAWLIKYCQKPISKESSAPFKQAEHPVKDGSNFYVAYAGFHNFIKKQIDKSTADKYTHIILESVGATKRKGGDRASFYEISEHNLYGESSLPLQAGLGQDDVSCGAHEEDETGGEVDPSDELWKEERRRSEK